MKKHLYLLALLLLTGISASKAQKLKTENVVLVTLDGMRWQEIFNGADSTLFKQQKAFKGPNGQAEVFAKNTLEERRQTLMPFLWGEIAKNGQIYGNRKLNNKVNVTNDQWFSYPGYNEILTGFADKKVNSNDKNYNANTTVLEYLNKQPAFAGKVAAFSSWEVFPFIINDKRSGIPVSAGMQPATGSNVTDTEKILNELMPRIPNPLGEVRLDAFTFQYALAYVKKNKPRVLFMAFDETDDFAHQGEYGAYLHAANNADSFIQQLWHFLQTEEQYRNKTTLLITTDHGRGAAAAGAWKDHGKDVNGADAIWLAVIGPDTPAMGEVKTAGQFYQNQVASTMATLLGLSYTNNPKPGAPVSAAFSAPIRANR
ncbi:phosphoglyceromutase [Adhaeribacter arboris]|uniref:Phosphoglyceromutase n=1 Tax=Adhaeribacter arboris TaxID=2072846 RepID=A0A2T2YK15_9BACT|nr:alkaline phosphatase family protein [Adhaeribacter arboris]PSR55856.1 phosphoglyceromutase [Adhaeribacter arboris]